MTASHATIRLRYGARMDRETALRRLYAAFNARDIDTTLAGMTADVDWPNGWEAGYVKGHDEVRGVLDAPVGRGRLDRGAARLQHPPGRPRRGACAPRRPHPAGELLFDHEGSHVYTFQGDLVGHMSIE